MRSWSPDSPAASAAREQLVVHPDQPVDPQKDKRIAGGFYANYVSFVGPEVFGFSFMISMIIMVLAGGKGTLVGPVIGAILVVLLEEYLRDFKELRFSIFGLIVMAVVLFLPRGIMGFITRRHETYGRGATRDA